MQSKTSEVSGQLHSPVVLPLGTELIKARHSQSRHNMKFTDVSEGEHCFHRLDRRVSKENEQRKFLLAYCWFLIWLTLLP
jgi:hypothetical protein